MKKSFKANELLYLSMLCGAYEVFSLPDVFHGKTEDEIKSYVDATSKACADKKFYTADFEGKRKLNASIDKAIHIIAAADTITELIIRNTKARQQRYLLYYKGKDKTILFESGGDYFICDEQELDKLTVSLRVLFAEGCLLKAETLSFAISQDEIEEARAGKKPKATAMRALMRDKGVDETTALLITEGIAGRAGYFSAATVNRRDNSVKTAYFLADSGMALQISTDEKGNMTFAAITNEAAMQTALSFVGGDFYV